MNLAPEAAGALASLVGLLIMLGVGIRQYLREKRALRAGLRDAKRHGMLPDDVQ